MRTKSYARVKNAAKLEANGRNCRTCIPTAAATIEPLHEHLADYEQHLANNLGFGAQACYRGPRLYDSEETKVVVKKWVAFFKKHRAILESDEFQDAASKMTIALGKDINGRIKAASLETMPHLLKR